MRKANLKLRNKKVQNVMKSGKTICKKTSLVILGPKREKHNQKDQRISNTMILRLQHNETIF